MKWQYYTNSKYFQNKFDAIDEFEAHRKDLRLETPESYCTYPFAQEPKEDFYTLLKQEAKYIRDNNNLIRLFYSGGADSDLILHTFLDNNIHIDEIVCMKSGFKDADFEINDHAIPTLQSQHDKLKSTKIRILTPSLQDYRKFYNSNWVDRYLRNEFVSTITFFRLIDQMHNFNDGAINIKGKDKPKLIMHHNKVYTYISDVGTEPNANEYNFYLENPKIHAKQCHLLMTQIDRKKFSTDTQSLINKSTGRYKHKDTLPLKHEANQKFVHNGRTIYHTNQKDKLAVLQGLTDCPDIIDAWQKGIEQLRSGRFNKWYNNGRPEYGTIGISSKFYCLDDSSTKTIDELYPTGFTPENIKAQQKT
jgi:hypothetical protein|tara:strand:+ start:4627 stop:5712 length:1086 start_codon:yes stop_codon:yes gene_type:complete